MSLVAQEPIRTSPNVELTHSEEPLRERANNCCLSEFLLTHVLTLFIFEVHRCSWKVLRAFIGRVLYYFRSFISIPSCFLYRYYACHYYFFIHVVA